MTLSTRAALSRDLIATTALALTDEGGLSGLSMRKLGNELGVEAMSLYHYVDNKDDLLDAMLDALFLEIELPVELPSHDWESAIRRGLRSFHDVLLRHSAALELFATRPAKSAETVGVLVWAYDRLQAAGLSLSESFEALHAGVAFVMGHAATETGAMALIEAGGGIDIDELPDPASKHLITQRRTITSERLFDAGMETLVAGLRATYDLP